jgi:hypothetical protein
MKPNKRNAVKQEDRDVVARAMEERLYCKIKGATPSAKYQGRNDSNKPSVDARGC